MQRVKGIFQRSTAALIGIVLLVSLLTPEPATADFHSDGVLRRVRVPVLMYHYVSNPPHDSDVYRLDLSVTPANFRQQLQWLKDHDYQSITPDDMAAALLHGRRLPDRPMLLTFDDGYADAYDNAFPLLREFGFKGTFFIVTSWLDENRPGYLTWAQVKDMTDAGMSIQSHSRTHHDMRNHDHDWLVYEILGPMQTIEAHTGARPMFFCYPAGDFDLNVVRELRAAGVVAAFMTNDGTYDYSDDMLRLPRVRIRGSTSIAVFTDLIGWQR